MTLEGVHVRTIGAGVIDGGVMGIAANADALAVGLYGAVSVFDIVNGDLIRSFGVHGSEEGDMNSCFGLRFTPDGGHILIADAGNCVVSLFTLTGTFVRCIGVDAVKSPVDVDVATNGDILVVDESIHRIFVFSSDGFALLRSFGAEGETPGLFKYPAALAIHRSQLYVLDSFSARVQAFN